MNYHKKPVVVDVVRWDGDNIAEVLELCRDGVMFDFPKIQIETLEGTMAADIGDYIIRGVQGELYPCKPDIFEQTYEEVTE